MRVSIISVLLAFCISAQAQYGGGLSGMDQQMQNEYQSQRSMAAEEQKTRASDAGVGEYAPEDVKDENDKESAETKGDAKKDSRNEEAERVREQAEEQVDSWTQKVKNWFKGF